LFDGVLQTCIYDVKTLIKRNLHMTNNTEQQLEQLKEMKQRLAQLSQQQDCLQEELHAERDQGLLDKNMLDQKVEQAELELQKLSKKLEKAKTHIKRRKNEIKQWKESFDRLEQLEKSQELAQLQTEIAWRAKDIASKEAEIAELYIAKTTLSGTLEALNIKKIIVEKGYHKKDISEDPRLQAVIEERNELQAALTKLGE
jgi:chromosome segregation ATPase